MTDENNPVAKLYAKLQKAIKKSKLSREQIALKAGRCISTSNEQLRKIEKNETVTTETLKKYCEIFKVK